MARGDKKTYNQQEQQAFGNANQAATQGFANQQASFAPALSGFEQEYANPGFSSGEQRAMRQAEIGSLAGAFGAARSRAADRAARTGNAAGMNATEEEMAREQGQQQAQALGSLAQAFGDARIAGQQYALAGESRLYGDATNAANAGLNAQGRDVATQGDVATRPGFWSRVLGGSLGALGAGAGSGLGRGLTGGGK